MIIPPESYIEQFKNASYDDLIKERDRLIKKIIKYEKSEEDDKNSDVKIIINPSPDVMYVFQLEYLSMLCKLMKDRYIQKRD